jgi:hypothetical protein
VKLLIALLILFSGFSVARSEVISYPEDQSKSGITVLETVLLMSEIETLLRDKTQSASSGFQWDFHWNKPWLGAGSVLTDDKIFQIMLWGGLVRADKMTIPALEAILCHEFGHLLGGTPRQIFPSFNEPGEEHWSSTEGQSDWWAATVCLPSLYRARGLNPNEIRDRILKAGLEFALFAQFHFEKGLPPPDLNLSAPEMPENTLTLAYPSLQCRLDTFRIGAESALGTQPPKRPRCWFAD